MKAILCTRDVLILFALMVLPFVVYAIAMSVRRRCEISTHSLSMDDFVKKYQFMNMVSAKKDDIMRHGLHNKTRLSLKDSERIYNKLEYELTHALGDNYREIFDLTKDYKREFHTPNDAIFWANRLLLSQDGMVLPNDCTPMGIEIGFDSCDWNVKLCKEIESNLISVYPESKADIRMKLKKSYANDDGFSGKMMFGIFNDKE